MSGIRVELVGGPLDGTLTLLPSGRPEFEFLVPLAPSPNAWIAAGSGVVGLRVGVYRLSSELSAAGADWVYRWVGERR